MKFLKVIVIIIILLSLSCSTPNPFAQPTATATSTPTNTPRPLPTPTPDNSDEVSYYRGVFDGCILVAIEQLHGLTQLEPDERQLVYDICGRLMRDAKEIDTYNIQREAEEPSY